VGLECVRNRLGEPEADGRRKPLPLEGSEFQIEADSIIVAIGQRPDVSFLDGSAVSLDARGAIPVDPETGLTEAESVYAGGDAARGPAIIIEACADGRRAAEEICRGFGIPFATVPAKLPILSQEPFSVTQSRQIIHVDNLCNECGNCATFCVHQGKPYLEKPRLFLDEVAFRSEENNAFFIEGSTIRRRQDGREARLVVEGDSLAFEDDHISLTMSSGFEIQDMALKKAFSGQRSLRKAAEMAVVLDGVKTSLSFLIGEE